MLLICASILAILCINKYITLYSEARPTDDRLSTHCRPRAPRWPVDTVYLPLSHFTGNQGLWLDQRIQTGDGRLEMGWSYRCSNTASVCLKHRQTVCHSSQFTAVTLFSKSLQSGLDLKNWRLIEWFAFVFKVWSSSRIILPKSFP